MKERRGEWGRGHFVGFDKRGAGRNTSVSVNILSYTPLSRTKLVAT